MEPHSPAVPAVAWVRPSVQALGWPLAPVSPLALVSAVGSGVAVGAGAENGVAVGCGVALGSGSDVGVAVGASVAVGSGVAVGVAVGSGVAVASVSRWALAPAPSWASGVGSEARVGAAGTGASVGAVILVASGSSVGTGEGGGTSVAVGTACVSPVVGVTGGSAVSCPQAIRRIRKRPTIASPPTPNRQDILIFATWLNARVPPRNMPAGLEE